MLAGYGYRQVVQAHPEPRYLDRAEQRLHAPGAPVLERLKHLVGHSVRSSVLCGPVSCREVDDVATTNESVARRERGGADGVDAVEPVAAYAGGSGRAGGGVAGGCRRAELHSRRAEGRTPR